MIAPHIATSNTYTRCAGAGLSIIPIAAVGLASCDVREALVGIQVNQGVQEPECRLSCTQTGIIYEGNDACSHGRGCGGSSTWGEFTALEHRIALARCQSSSTILESDNTHSGDTL